MFENVRYWGKNMVSSAETVSIHLQLRETGGSPGVWPVFPKIYLSGNGVFAPLVSYLKYKEEN